MKVIHVVLNLDCGGLEQLVVELSDFRNKKNDSTEIVCLAHEGDLGKKARQLGVEVFSLEKKEKFSWSTVSQLAKLLKERKADIIHTHNFSPLIYGTLAAKLIGKPCLNTRHGRAPKKTNRLIWAWNKYVVAVSNDAKVQMMKCNSINKSKVKVIYNGINMQTFTPSNNASLKAEIRKKYGLRPDSIVVGTVGRLSEEKDQNTFLKSFKKSKRKESLVEVVIVGDGPLKSELMKTAKLYEIEDKVKFIGYCDSVHEILEVFDIFVLSSIMEGIPLTILEAMAMGKPVIATKVGGNPEVIEDGDTGFLVPCGFPERIESAVMKMVVNPKIMKTIGDAGQRRVREMFSLTKMAKDYEDLYNTI